MKANEKLVWGARTGSALLIPIILVLVMDSPWYLLLIVALLAVIGALWFFRDGRWEAASTSAPPSREREPAQAAEPLLEEVLTEVELPTARPDYAVIFSARVNWQPIPAGRRTAPRRSGRGRSTCRHRTRRGVLRQGP